MRVCVHLSWCKIKLLYQFYLLNTLLSGNVCLCVPACKFPLTLMIASVHLGSPYCPFESACSRLSHWKLLVESDSFSIHVFVLLHKSFRGLKVWHKWVLQIHFEGNLPWILKSGLSSVCFKLCSVYFIFTLKCQISWPVTGITYNCMKKTMTHTKGNETLILSMQMKEWAY